MKEKVDRILKAEAVDIVSKAEFCLSVRKYDDGDAFQVGFATPSAVKKYGQVLNVDYIRKAGKALIELADELESRKKFKENDRYYYVSIDGYIIEEAFSKKSSFGLTRLYMGNAFKTREEAEAHKDEILAKFQELKGKWLA